MNLLRSIRCRATDALRAGAGGRVLLRAIGGDEKEARRQAILDAADRLFIERQGMANVADVAEAAGLAKGTVYLYFQSKEEIYLALHLRYAEGFFAALIERLDGQQTFQFDDMQALADAHILGATSYLLLSACCIGFASGSVRAEAAAHFQGRMSEWLGAAGVGLERRFPRLQRGEGVRLLKHSYAFMLGLYSLMRGEEGAEPHCPAMPGIGCFRDEAAIGLARYWGHVTGTDDSPVNLGIHNQRQDNHG